MRDGTAPIQGIQPGDIVIEVEGRDIANTSEMVYANRLNLGKTQEWTIIRAGVDVDRARLRQVASSSAAGADGRPHRRAPVLFG